MGLQLTSLRQGGLQQLHRLFAARFMNQGNCLGVSWIQGDIHIVYYPGRQAPKQWKSEHPVRTADEFKNVLLKAKAALCIPAECNVFMVLDIDQMQHSLVTAPPVKSKHLKKILLREVQSEQAFEGEVSWSWSNALTDERSGEHRLLLHMMPKQEMDDIILVISPLGLYPKAIAPLAEVLNSHIGRLNIAGDDVLVLLATFAGKTDILVAKGSGQILFIRDLSYAVVDHYEQVLRDVKLSLLYAKQKFSSAVTRISVAGESSAPLEEFLRSNLDLDFIMPDGDWHHAYCWAMDAAEFRRENTANFVPASVHRKHLTRTAIRWGVGGTALLAIVTMIVVAQVEYIIASSKQVKGSLEQLQQLQAEMDMLQAKQRQFDLLKQRLDYISTDQHGDHMLEFFKFLGGGFPEDMTLMAVEMGRDEQRLTFSLDGRFSSHVSASSAVKQIDAQANVFTSPPVNAHLEDWHENLDQVLRAGGTNSQQRQMAFSFKGWLQ